MSSIRSLFKDHGFYLIYGARRRGKTYFTRWLLYHQLRLNFYDYIVVFTGSGDAATEWDFVADRKMVFTNFTEAKVRYFYDLQKRWTLQGIERKLVIVLDDVSSVIPPSSSIYVDLAQKGRHNNIAVFFLAQSLKESRHAGVPVCCRDNTDYMISFFVHNENVIESIYREGGLGRNFHGGYTEFLDYFNENVRDHRCIVVDKTEDRRDNYWLMKAKEVPRTFRFYPTFQLTWQKRPPAPAPVKKPPTVTQRARRRQTLRPSRPE